MENNKPLVSFWIPVFNHEKYVKECVESALAQTYSPLEIIISDDCSTDRSFEIIKETVAYYKGPHKVILNRNSKNLGIGAHQNKKRELSHGEFIMGCAGDDVALPNKVEVMVERWLKSEKKRHLFFSNAIIIDENGSERGLYFDKSPRYCATLTDFIDDKRNRLSKILEPSVWVLGATSGITRQILESFDKIHPKVMQEDAVYSFRALLLGGMEYIDEPLTKYRVHSASISSKTNYKSVARLLSREYYYIKQQIADAHKAGASKSVLWELRKNQAVAIAKKLVFQIPVINVKIVSMIKNWNSSRK